MTTRRGRRVANCRASALMITIDGDKLTVCEDGERRDYSLSTPEAFNILSRLWLRSGLDNKYLYSFTWLGRPVIQLPEDLIRIQEVINSIRPDVIVESGIAHGGSLIFYASLCKVIGHGRVIGIDIDIRPPNRTAIESHFLSSLITLVEGDSVDPAVVTHVKSLVNETETVLVLLDSNHTKAHVLAELNAYAPLVSKGSYLVAMDGIMESMAGAPRTQPDWSWNNPKRAALEFVQARPEFAIEKPPFLFNEGNVTEGATYWPSGFIKRIK